MTNSTRRGLEDVENQSAGDKFTLSYRSRLIRTLFRHKFLVLILLLTTAIYLNSLNNDFVSDDLPMLENTKLLSRNLRDGIDKPDIRHAPLLYTTYFMNYLITDGRPFSFHLANLLLYLTLILTVYLFVKEIAPGYENLVTLFYAIHPVHTEAVSFVSARPYLIYPIFFLFSAICYLKWTQNRRRLNLLASLFFSALAYFSNPLAISLPLIILLSDLFSGDLKKRWRMALIFTILALIITTSVFLVRTPLYSEISQVLYGQKFSPAEQSLSKVSSIPTALAGYLNLLFLTQAPAFSHQTQTNLMTAAIITGLSLTALAYFKLKGQKKFRLSVFCLLFFLVTLLPSLNPFTANPAVADRYFFLPSLGLIAFFSLVVSPIFELRWLKRNIIRGGALLILTTLLSYQTILRNRDWKNEKTLFLANVRTDFSSPYPHFRLGVMAVNENKLTEAEFHFRMASSLTPDFFLAHRELGRIYLMKKENTQARSSLEKALKMKPDDIETQALIYILEKRGGERVNNHAD